MEWELVGHTACSSTNWRAGERNIPQMISWIHSPIKRLFLGSCSRSMADSDNEHTFLGHQPHIMTHDLTWPLLSAQESE